MRSFLAVMAGFVTIVVLSIGMDEGLRALGVFPAVNQPMGSSLYVLATLYRTLFSVIGSYVVARVAPNKPMQHALFAGLVGLVLSSVGAIITWNFGAGFGPKWYPIALILITMPTAWAGAKLFELSRRSSG
jgi:hypothetical protein